jgi:hypothetical protein
MDGVDHRLEYKPKPSRRLFGIKALNLFKRSLRIAEENRDLLPLSQQPLPRGQDALPQMSRHKSAKRLDGIRERLRNQESATIRAEPRGGSVAAVAGLANYKHLHAARLAKLTPIWRIVLAIGTPHVSTAPSLKMRLYTKSSFLIYQKAPSLGYRPDALRTAQSLQLHPGRRGSEPAAVKLRQDPRLGGWRRMLRPITVPSRTFIAANEVVVPCHGSWFRRDPSVAGTRGGPEGCSNSK